MLLEIITPEKIVYKEEIEEIVIPTVNGQIAILPNHIGLLTQIVTGEIIIKKSNKTESIAITGGFLEVDKNHLTVLADYAKKAEDIEIAKVEEARKKAERLMREKTSDRDFKIAEAELLKSLLQLKIAGKYRKRPYPTS